MGWDTGCFDWLAGLVCWHFDIQGDANSLGISGWQGEINKSKINTALWLLCHTPTDADVQKSRQFSFLFFFPDHFIVLSNYLIACIFKRQTLTVSQVSVLRSIEPQQNRTNFFVTDNYFWKKNELFLLKTCVLVENVASVVIIYINSSTKKV